MPEMWPVVARLTAMACQALGVQNLDLLDEFRKPLEVPEVTDQMRLERAILSEGMGPLLEN